VLHAACAKYAWITLAEGRSRPLDGGLRGGGGGSRGVAILTTIPWPYEKQVAVGGGGSLR